MVTEVELLVRKGTGWPVVVVGGYAEHSCAEPGDETVGVIVEDNGCGLVAVGLGSGVVARCPYDGWEGTAAVLRLDSIGQHV